MKTGLVIFILLAVLFGIFILQNPSQIEFQFILWKVNMSPATLILIVFALGILLAVFWLLPSLLKKKKEIRLLKKELDELKAANPDDDNNPEGPKLGDDSFKSFFND